ncbi:hypothetical protein KM043_010958 [Ampulex compressa]|nr:hypothetical protein KM043_010958 [Ampulex compressa]
MGSSYLPVAEGDASRNFSGILGRTLCARHFKWTGTCAHVAALYLRIYVGCRSRVEKFSYGRTEWISEIEYAFGILSAPACLGETPWYGAEMARGRGMVQRGGSREPRRGGRSPPNEPWKIGVLGKNLKRRERFQAPAAILSAPSSSPPAASKSNPKRAERQLHYHSCSKQRKVCLDPSFIPLAEASSLAAAPHPAALLDEFRALYTLISGARRLEELCASDVACCSPSAISEHRESILDVGPRSVVIKESSIVRGCRVAG